jgi:membrane peptidoglycan carboxypeptidase
VLRELDNEMALGGSVQERNARLALGGLTITTGLDPRMQFAAQVGANRLDKDDRVVDAVAMVEPGTGVVRALAVNRDFGVEGSATVYPLLSEAVAPGASLFKVFTLTAAVEGGAGPDTVLPGGSSHQSRVFDNPASGAFTNSDGGGRVGPTLAEATWASQNTAFVQLLERVGVDRAAEMARRLGAVSLTEEVGDREGSFTLGARPVSVIEMANVFATLAADGRRCVPTAVVSIVDASGPLPVTSLCQQAVSAQVARSVSSILEGVVTNGTGERAQLGRPVAGKTGTSDDFGAAWFAGYTPQLATAVWLGDPRGPSYPLVDVAGHERVYGGGLPAESFAAAMRLALADQPVVGFPGPVGPVVGGGGVLDDVVGMNVDQAVRLLNSKLVATVVEVTDGPGQLAAGVVLSTSPGPGEVVNGTVLLRVSDGG